MLRHDFIDIVWLADSQDANPERVGYKTGNLVRLYHRGNVPNGFCLTASVYQTFLRTTGLYEIIGKALAPARLKNTHDVMTASEQIRTAFDRTDVPTATAAAIRDGYRRLGATAVAVRSSSTGEDLPSASSAGMQETFLHVEGAQDVIRRTKDCWMSFFAPRAIGYRQALGMAHEEKSVAVLVQQMLTPLYAGVVFSVHPVRKRDLLLEAVEGTGDQLVSGIVTPNQYSLDRMTLNVLNRRETFEIDEMVLRSIGREALAIEALFGRPMDIEFVVDGKRRLWIVQARPITTLAENRSS